MEFVSSIRFAKPTNSSNTYHHALGLLIIASIGVALRCFSIFRFESVIHEYDPWFNFRCTQYLRENGIKKFMSWFDELSWYPQGRAIGQTVYPGMMVLTNLVYQCIALFYPTIDIKDVAVCMGPGASVLTCVFGYLITILLSPHENGTICGLSAAFFLAIIPGYIARSIAGAFDYESISILLMLVVFNQWMLAVRKTTSPFYSYLNSLASAMAFVVLASTWGGYVYALNLIPLHAMAVFILHKRNLFNQYAIFYLISESLLMALIPRIGLDPLTSIEHWPAMGTFLALGLCKVVGTKKVIMLLSCATPVIGFVVNKVGITGRLFHLFFATKHHSVLVESILEHKTPSWKVLFTEMHYTIPLAVPTLYTLIAASGSDPVALFMVIYAITAAYFTGIMIRIVPVFAPCTCILAGMMVGRIIGDAHWISLLCFLLLGHQFIDHSLKATTTVYSSPSFILASKNSATGQQVNIDDFRAAYSWLRNNTDKEAHVLAWWDYGYQITGMAHRTTYNDNNTRDLLQMAKVAKILLTNEQEAWRQCREWKVDYVLVVYGGAVSYTWDDLKKSYWMVKIAEEQGLVRFSEYYGPYGFTAKLRESLLYRASYQQLRGQIDGDGVRKGKVPEVGVMRCFEEAFTTQYAIVRIYKTKEQCF